MDIDCGFTQNHKVYNKTITLICGRLGADETTFSVLEHNVAFMNVDLAYMAVAM